MRDVTVSLVVYHNVLPEIKELLDQLERDATVASWVVVDNGDSEQIRDAVQSRGGIYIRSGSNIGFGKAHNLALRKLADSDATYHLILNPDITFGSDVLGKLADLMNKNWDVGLVMPKIIYPDGSTQYLCKLLPSPTDLILRRFAPNFVRRLFKKRIVKFDLRNFDYERPAYIPSLSGCFMFARRSVLEQADGFDERFFLYMEDLDLCRRMSAFCKLLYWPSVRITHVHQRESYKSLSVLFIHIQAAFAYFNKWGWLEDCERDIANKRTLIRLEINDL